MDRKISNRKSGYLLGFGGAIAMLSMIAGLEVEVAAARGGAEPIAVNRVLKGDRLMADTSMPTAAATPRPAMRAGEPQLPNECHASFNIGKSAFAREVAGRCVS
jgi:hypothetical protein